MPGGIRTSCDLGPRPLQPERSFCAWVMGRAPWPRSDPCGHLIILLQQSSATFFFDVSKRSKAQFTQLNKFQLFQAQGPIYLLPQIPQETWTQKKSLLGRWGDGPSSLASSGWQGAHLSNWGYGAFTCLIRDPRVISAGYSGRICSEEWLESLHHHYLWCETWNLEETDFTSRLKR